MQRSIQNSLHVTAHAAAAAHAAPVASIGVAGRSTVPVTAAAGRSTPVPPGELHPPPLRACMVCPEIATRVFSLTCLWASNQIVQCPASLRFS